jgi:hypothetical protein
MKEIGFPEWKEVLAATGLPEARKRSMEITLRWFLSFCRRGRSGVTVQAARDFVAWAAREKKAQPWQIEQWKEAVRWFFRSAQSGGQDCRSAAVGQAQSPEQARPVKARGEELPEWKADFLTVVRRRNYSYRTEQSYQVWIERFARYLGSADLKEQDGQAIKGTGRGSG